MLNGFLLEWIPILNEYKSQNNTSPFNPKSFIDSFDGRLFCSLLSVNTGLLSISNVLGLKKEAIHDFHQLFDIVKSELGCEEVNLFPILQSPSTLSLKFPKILPSKKKSDYGFIRLQSPMLQSLIPELEQKLNSEGLISHAKKIAGKQKRLKFYKEQNWNRGGIVFDGIKPYKYEHRNYQKFMNFISKYAKSLEGGKIVLRDVIVSKKHSSAKNTKNTKNGNTPKSKNVGGRRNKGKKRNDIRDNIAKEIAIKQREEKLEKITNKIRWCDRVHGKDIEMKIKELEALLEDMNDPLIALPGLKQLYYWCASSALKSKPERNMYPVVRLWQATFDIIRRFVENASVDAELPSVELIQILQKGLQSIGFALPAERITQIYVNKQRERRVV